ncbi:MAG: diphthine synthase, partial [Candidatus Nanohaloarchaea archaeon]
MLSLVGLGLRDGDISLRGLEALERADRAYAEFYTNPAEYDLGVLEERTGTGIEILDRSEVEEKGRVVETAVEEDVVFLVSGDPLAATTHQDVLFRARERGIETEVIHAPSIFTAVAETGLSLYKFGRTTTLTLQNGEVPGSVLEAIERNREDGLHTLVLVDPELPLDEMLEAFAERWDSEVLLCSGLGTPESELGRDRPENFPRSDLDQPVSIVVTGVLSGNEEERLE